MRNRQGSLLAVLLILFGGLLAVEAAEAEDELFVANEFVNEINVYSRTANGNTAPLRTLTGAATGLNQPVGLALAAVASTSTPVPTLSGWAQFGMALILVGTAVWCLRRR